MGTQRVGGKAPGGWVWSSVMRGVVKYNVGVVKINTHTT